MASKKQSPAMEFVVAALKKNPGVDYASVKDAAGQRGLTIFPIMYGRAKALLGLVPVAQRGSKKKAVKKPAAPRKTNAGVPRRPPARANHAAGSTLDSLQSLVAGMKQVSEDRDRFQRALEEIAEILDRTL